MERFKTYCVLANGETKTCYPYDYKKKQYDYDHPLVKKYGDKWVYVETLKGAHYEAEKLSFIERFED